jgi:hypothetical protein
MSLQEPHSLPVDAYMHRPYGFDTCNPQSSVCGVPEAAGMRGSLRPSHTASKLVLTCATCGICKVC